VRTTLGPQRLVAYDVELPEVDVFRIVRAEDPEDPVFLNSLRSNFQLGEEPRKVERRSALVHMGISVYLVLHAASETAERWPKIGAFHAPAGARRQLR